MDLRSLNRKKIPVNGEVNVLDSQTIKFLIREAVNQISYLFIKRHGFFYIFEGLLRIFLVT